MLGIAARLTVGDLRYDTHAVHLAVRRGVLPILDRLDVRLPGRVRFEAAAQDDVSLDLNGGEGATTVFTGTVTSTSHELSGPQLRAHHGSWDLARYRPSLSLEQVTVGDVVRQLCDDAGVTVDTMFDGPTLARYVATARATALDEVTRLLHMAGGTAAFDGEGRLAARAGEPAAERGLRYGRELGFLQVSGQPPAVPARVTVGEGAGDPGAANALWPTDDFWSGRAADPGPGARRRITHELRTTGDAETAGAAWHARHLAELTPIMLRCWLVPDIGPNELVHVQDAPDSLGIGAVRVRQVVHRVHPARGATTDIWGYDESAAAEGLLGALAGLAGGLL